MAVMAKLLYPLMRVGRDRAEVVIAVPLAVGKQLKKPSIGRMVLWATSDAPSIPADRVAREVRLVGSSSSTLLRALRERTFILRTHRSLRSFSDTERAAGSNRPTSSARRVRPAPEG